MKKFAFVSLGCDKNRVDSEKIIYSLVQNGFEMCSDYNEANIIFINTCAFIKSAIQESIDTILEFNQFRESKLEKLIVLGCFANRFANENELDFKEVDKFVCTEQYGNILEIIDELYKNESNAYNSDILFDRESNEKKVREVFLQDFRKRILTTKEHVAFLKISEGCDKNCTYCTIPFIRGKQVSSKKEFLLQEAEKLHDNGVKELILVAQDVTAYGIDLYKKFMLVELLNDLSKIEFHKIRLMYCYPELISDELIDIVANTKNIAKYLDIPFQHVNDRILGLMGRKSTHKSLQSLIDKLRNKKIAIRATFMVGFPSETNNDFLELYNFIDKNKFEHLAVFSFSKEDGTKASVMQNQVLSKEKTSRYKKLCELGFHIAKANNEKMIGKTIEVIYEDIDFQNNLFIGRSEQDAYEVDSCVYFSSRKPLMIGNYYNVKITAFHGYDLLGEVAD